MVKLRNRKASQKAVRIVGAPERISVIVPRSPFIRADLQKVKHCLAAIDVAKLMEWWPGLPHMPHRNPDKVKSIQRSLDWKRVAQIASYLLQEEIVGAPDIIDTCFRKIYEPRRHEPGRQWPPRVSRVVGYERSEYPVFSNVLIHVNGADFIPIAGSDDRAADLVFDGGDPNLNFSVIDGQHRINGAFLAVHILQSKAPGARWEIPCEIFLDLDPPGTPPRRQAQIFIDVNFYQKKVDRSLVADLFPTARGRTALDDTERAQDIGRKLMLETGPLKGMIQIPGIKYGVKDVVTLATLNAAIETVLPTLTDAEIPHLEGQTSFLALCLDAWLVASGRKEDPETLEKLDPNNVAYQGRVLVGFLTLVPACLWVLKNENVDPLAPQAAERLTKWLSGVVKRAGLLDAGRFLGKADFKEKGYLGSGGTARFRDLLWASALNRTSVEHMEASQLSRLAGLHRERVLSDLGAS